MKDTDELKRLLNEVTNRIGSQPTTVYLREELNAIILEIKCEPLDVGKLIGVGGGVANSLTMVFCKMSAQLGKAVLVDVIKTDQRRKDFTPFRADPKYQPADEIMLLTDMAEFMFNDGAGVRDTSHEDGVVELTISCDEPEDRNLQLALTTLFSAIGHKKGARIKVAVEQL